MNERGSRLRVAVAQMNSGPDPIANLTTMSELLIEAVSSGCDLVAFPENCLLLAPTDVRLLRACAVDSEEVRRLGAMAKQLSVHVLVGSISERSDDPDRTWNTSILLDAVGETNALYRKVHLFDVAVARDTTMQESASTLAGPVDGVAVGDVAGWKVGLSVCYDLRFPELYRALVSRGAEILAVPAAFTFRTGASHWEVLLRARAIENQCYVIAPAQTGRHYGQRESWGHAMIVSPWGDVLATAWGENTLAIADLDRSWLQDVRRRIPCLDHRRL